MVKEIERAGLPVVHICTVVPISLTVGANRIVPAIAIPHPLGNPKLDADEEKAIRRKMDIDKLRDVVRRLRAPKNIHLHLDLIAGLPYEDIESFRNSFNERNL